MELSPRLKTIYELLPEGCVPVDVGTDHGHLPIFALLNQKIARAYATDLREGPLANGRENARAFGLEDKITFLLSDGLQALAAEDIAQLNTVICAGMGGILIQNIVKCAPFLKDPRFLLLLQPQKAIYETREVLAQAGFAVERERLSREGDKFYWCFALRFAGKTDLPQNPYFYIKNDPLFAEFYSFEHTRLSVQKNGMLLGGVPDRALFDTVCTRLQFLEEYKNEGN